MVSVSPSLSLFGPDCTLIPATCFGSWDRVYSVDHRMLQIDSVKRMNLNSWRHVLGRFSNVEITESKIIHMVLAADHFIWAHNFTVLRLRDCSIKREVLLGIINHALALEQLRLSNLQVETSSNRQTAMDRYTGNPDDPVVRTKLRVLELVGMDSLSGISPVFAFLAPQESLTSPFELDVLAIRSESEYNELNLAFPLEVLCKNDRATEMTLGEREIQMILESKGSMLPPRPLSVRYLTLEVSTFHGVEAFLLQWLRFLPVLNIVKIVVRG
ncbi:uncharacterized protein BT62DRAFT_995766 [Guyanagaster necrorhizus]|uniref:Uncharacterized protein n=1 Tax=Guyanagaster necrorhizus TaxID=856835 RepID=A0A9P7VP41_9AGAR|nr:uncharacterized protein BT62DRAFT_995766 [Guyanagaster necrorhizus MCA 3950]KAG7444027.1 hypothetical protein BT62DRAFT_995766 [Guyanagaster necrorhizus MCA 3950]